MNRTAETNLLEALGSLPSSLSFEQFVKHPSIQALNLEPLSWREVYELYDMY